MFESTAEKLVQHEPTNSGSLEGRHQIQLKTPENIKYSIASLDISAAKLLASLDQAQRQSQTTRIETTKQSLQNIQDPANTIQSVKETVVHILQIARNDSNRLSPQHKPPVVASLASAALKNISEQVPQFCITDQTAPYIFSLCNDIIKGSISDIGSLAQKFDQLKHLRDYSPEAYEKIQKALINTAKERGLSQQEANEQFGLGMNENDDLAREIRESRDGFNNSGGGEDAEFWNSYRTYYHSYFKRDEDLEVLMAIHNKKRFLKYIDKVRNQMKNKGDFKNEKDLDKKISEEIRRKIILIVAAPYELVDNERPTVLFQELTKERNPMYGIQPTTDNIRTAIDVLIKQFVGEHEHDYKYYKKFVSVEVDEELKDPKHPEKGVYTYRKVNSVFQDEKINLPEFVRDIYHSFNEYLELRELTHNINSIFFQPPQEKGFYAGLKGFAERIQAANIDELKLIPDANIFKEAYHLYDKFIEEDFAYNNWIHDPVMFSKAKENRTKIQEEVLERLKLFYPEVEELRLKAALTMAIGASRGIFFGEVEKSSFADPPIDPRTGKAFTIPSYYTKDATALTPFNPLHYIWRWQFEDTTNPIFFLPINVDFSGAWDHNIVYEQIRKQYAAFSNGKDPKDTIQTILDFLVNIGGIGGPFQRKGWRYEKGFAGLFQYTDRKEGSIDFLNTWKVMENVGIESLIFFVKSRLIKEGKVPADDDTGKKIPFKTDSRINSERMRLFEYIYKKYFTIDGKGNNATNLSLNEYLDFIRVKEREQLIKNINKGLAAPEDINVAVEAATTDTFLFKALTRIVAQRMPTKLIRYGRNREAADGRRSWEKLRLQANEQIKTMNEIDRQRLFSKEDAKSKEFNTAIFNETIQDIMMVEAILRKEISEEMATKSEAAELGNLTTEYNLTKEKLRDILRKYLKEKGNKVDKDSPERIKKRIERALLIFEKMQDFTGDFSGTDNKDSRTNREKFLDSFESHIRGGIGSKYPFSFAGEELDFNYLSFSAMGPRILVRAISDMSDVETHIVTPILSFPKLLHTIATSGKNDMSEVVKMLAKVKEVMSNVQGPEDANRIVRHLALMTICYFRKDTAAKRFTGAAGLGTLNSLAAEFARSSVGIVEWDSLDIDKFVMELELKRILPREGFELHKEIEYEPVYIKNPFTKEPMKTPWKRRKRELQETSVKLRNESGGKIYNILTDIWWKYGPIMVAMILYFYMKNAFEKTFGKKEN